MPLSLCLHPSRRPTFADCYSICVTVIIRDSCTANVNKFGTLIRRDPIMIHKKKDREDELLSSDIDLTVSIRVANSDGTIFPH